MKTREEVLKMDIGDLFDELVDVHLMLAVNQGRMSDDNLLQLLVLIHQLRENTESELLRRREEELNRRKKTLTLVRSTRCIKTSKNTPHED